jgi:hypothetical protein
MNLIITFLALISWLTPPDSVRFGVDWSVPIDANQAQKELSYFQKNGYQDILIKGIIPIDVLDVLDRYDFDVHVLSDLSYITSFKIEQNKVPYEVSLLDYFYYYKPYECIKSLGLFEFGAVYNDSFSDAIQALSYRIKPTVTKDLFYIHQPDSIDKLQNKGFKRFLTIYEHTDLKNITDTEFEGLVYRDQIEQLSARKFQEIIFVSGGKTIFFSSELIFNEQKQAELSSWITTFLKDSSSLLELKATETKESHPDYLVILFWACVVLFGLHYSFEPNYRKSVSRYFLAHAFFASDIMDNRVRLSFSASLAGLVQSSLAGMMSLLFFEHILSDVGLDALTSEFPYLSYFVYSKLGQFLFGFIHYSLLTGILIVWLHVVFSDFKSVHQPATLILWPQLTNLFLSILVVNAFFNSVSGFWIIVFSVLYLLVVFFSYYFALLDIFKSGRKTRTTDWLKTGIPYSFILIGFIGFYLYYIGFYDMLVLAYHLH